MKKGKVILALSLLVGMPALMFFLSTLADKRYTAQSRLQVDPIGMRTEYPDPMAPIADLQRAAKPRSIGTQVQIMTGTEVLGAALQKAREALPNKLGNEGSASAAYENLVRRLQVDSDPMSDVVGLRVTQNDPEVAAELANDIAYAYKDYADRKVKESTNNLLTTLNHNVDEMKGKLSRIDDQVADLKLRAKVADSNAANQVEQNLVAQNRTQRDLVESQYLGAVAELDVAKRLLSKIPRTIVGSRSTQANPVQISLETDLSRMRSQLADLRSQYNDDFPQVKGLLEQIRQGEAALKKYKTSIDSGTNTTVNPEYQAQSGIVLQLEGRTNNLRNQLVSLRTTGAVAETHMSELPGLQRQIDALQRDKIALESSYGQLVQRRDIAQAGKEAQQSTVQVVSTAFPPDGPSFPDPRLFVLAGLAVGGFLAILILMPRQETPTYSGDLYPTVYAAPPAPTDATVVVREPVTTTSASGDVQPRSGS